ncbi:33918_t:CDS:2, partial [Racocetra persica]
FVKRKEIDISTEGVLSVDPDTKCLVGNWSNCISQLLIAANKQTKKTDLPSLLEAKFSTTMQSSFIASKITLLDNSQDRCSYNLGSYCVDQEFWKGIAREEYGCGGLPELTGWVTSLFPYDSSDEVVNNWLDEYRLPSGRVAIPFNVESGQKKKFISGFLAVHQE